MSSKLSSFSSHNFRRDPDSIVLLQWENLAGASSPRLKFWTIQFPAPTKDSPKTKEKPLPIPTAIEDRIDEASCISFGTNRRQGRLQLPPLMAYDETSGSIVMHNLMAGDKKTDSELLSWGPGLRLSKIRINDGFFDEPLASLTGTRFLSNSAVEARHSSSRAWGTKLTAAAHRTKDGSISVKYRSRSSQDARWASLIASETEIARAPQEQIVRTVSTGVSHEAATPSAVPEFSVPLHSLTIGNKEYTVLIALGSSKDGSQTQVSLYTTSESDVKAEAESVKQPRDDLGLRWQVQTFFLPSGVTNVAPIVRESYEKPHYHKYLVLFYSYNGTMYYSHMRYAGSGFFDNHVSGIPCFLSPDPEEEQGKPTPAPKSASRSRWSLTPTSLLPPKVPVLDEPQPKEDSGKFIQTASQECQPTVIKANGSLWLFYQGPDGKGRYVAHSSHLTGIKDLETGWKEASWSAEPLLDSKSEMGGEEDFYSVSRHFLPVVVPNNFMAMS